MKQLQLHHKISVLAASLVLLLVPSLQVGSASAITCTLEDNRTYGNYLGHDVIHSSTEGWAMRAYNQYVCLNSPGARETKFGFYSDCHLRLQYYDNSGSKPVLMHNSWTSPNASGSGCHLHFAASGSMVIYNSAHHAVWSSHTTISNGNINPMHIAVVGTGLPRVVIYRDSSTVLWSEFVSGQL